MPDRSMGGTGIRDGTIELMFARRGSTSDELGMPEPLDEILEDLPIRSHHAYKLKFSKQRKELYDAIHKHSISLGMNPLNYFLSKDFKVIESHKNDKKAELSRVVKASLLTYLKEYSVLDV